MPNGQLHLNLFIFDTGHHEAAWRRPESNPHANLDIGAFQQLARTAEQARFDSIFLADSPSLMGDPRRRPTARLDPTILLAALSASTSHIGLIATASTTYNDPYSLARRFSSIDHISGGRAGWNIVTTWNPDAARNHGREHHPEHADRYAMAQEFLEVATALWTSWDADAVVADKVQGVHAMADRIHSIRHHGKHFQVEGPLTLSRSPQVFPVLVQAGSSEAGKAFAARWAEAVFTAQSTFEDARAFYQDIKARARAFGRDPAHLKILPGVVPFVADTEEEARQLKEELDRLITPEYAVAQLAKLLNVPVESLQVDGLLPDDVPEEAQVQGARSRRTLIVEMARRDRLTVRELIQRLGGGRGHWTLVGTPSQVADALQHYFEQGAADGFNIMPPLLPHGLDAFASKVVPILRDRGLFRSEYSGRTLRDHYGLPLPGTSGFPVGRDAGEDA